MKKFKVGDKVKACGLNGVVDRIEASAVYPIIVKFETGNYISFTYDGKQYDWHKIPSLKLRKLKKPVPREIWVNHYRDKARFSYDLKEIADYEADVSHPDRIGGKAWRYVLAKKQD